MTRHGTALLALSVLAIAGWTYNVNYDTRAALDRLSELRGRIAEEREALQVLRVEWAWLNAPDRLARLVGEHQQELALLPLAPEALGIVAAVPYPPDTPVDPLPPAEPPEALIAAAPQAPAAEMRPGPADDLLAMTVQADDAAASEGHAADPAREEARPWTDGREEPQLAEAGRSAGLQETVAQLAEASQGSSEATLGAGGDTTAEKAAVLTQRSQPPVSMEEAVTLALVEAGVVDAAAIAAPIVAAKAPAGIPMPLARPAVWTGR